MNNLHLLIIGSTEQEIRANVAEALDHAFRNHANTGDSANCISGGEWEYEFRQEKFIADICEAYIGQVDLTRQPLELLEALSKAIRNELDTRADKRVQSGDFVPANKTELYLVQSGKMVEAVMAYRQRNSCSLYLAKKVLDKYR